MTHNQAPDHRGGGGDFGASTHRDLVDIAESPPLSSFPFELSNDVASDTGRGNPETKSMEVPYDGFITGVVLAWQDGSNNSTGIQFRRRSGEVFLPRNDDEAYIAFPGGGGAHPFTVTAPVREGEHLVAEYINTDTTNNHFVNCVPIIREAETDGS